MYVPEENTHASDTESDFDSLLSFQIKTYDHFSAFTRFINTTCSTHIENHDLVDSIECLPEVFENCKDRLPSMVFEKERLLEDLIKAYIKKDPALGQVSPEEVYQEIAKIKNGILFERAHAEFREALSIRTSQIDVFPQLVPIVQKGEHLYDQTRKLKESVDTIEDLPKITQLLTYATQALNAPNDLGNLNDLRDHAMMLKELKGSGKKSWGKILGGTALALAGTVLMLGSAAVAVASFGTSTPLSIIGAAGATAAIVVGAVAIATGMGSTALTLGGIGLSIHGREKGILKTSLAFAEATDSISSSVTELTNPILACSIQTVRVDELPHFGNLNRFPEDNAEPELSKSAEAEAQALLFAKTAERQPPIAAFDRKGKGKEAFSFPRQE